MGAEIVLYTGTTTVGRNNSCDIILQDSTVAERHLRILVSEDISARQVLKIDSIDAPFTMVSQPADQEIEPGSGEKEAPRDASQLETSEWPALTPLMLGTTCLVWKHEEDAWKDIQATGILDGPSFLQSSALEEKPGKEAGDGKGDSKEETKKTIVLPVWLSRGLKALGLILIFLFIFGPCLDFKSVKLARNMHKLLEKAGFEYLTVTQTNIGVTVLGTVDTQKDRRSLWQIAGKVDYPVFIDVKVREERSYAVKVALSVRGLFPEIELDGNDILMTGYMRDKLIEGAAKVWIKKDITQVENITSSMVYAFQVWPLLKDRIIKYHLEDLVIIRFHPGLVQVEGELDFDQRQVLETIKGEVCEELNSPIAFWDTLTAPGFSAEWNASLNEGGRSKYAPDSGLSQLYLDSQTSKGLPAFSAAAPSKKALDEPEQKSEILPLRPAPLQTQKQSGMAGQTEKGAEDQAGGSDGEKVRYARDDEGKFLTDSEGNPIILGTAKDEQGNILRDADNVPIPLTVARDAEGRIVRDKKGNPVLVPSLLDKHGRVLRDRGGKPVAPRVITGVKKRAVLDKEGNLIPDQNANKILIDRLTPQTKEDGQPSAAGRETGQDSYFDQALLDSDKKLFGSGTVIADSNKADQEAPEDPLGGLEILSITLEPIPFISMKDGQKFFTGGKLPSGYIIKKIGTDRLVLERGESIKTYKIRLR